MSLQESSKLKAFRSFVPPRHSLKSRLSAWWINHYQFIMLPCDPIQGYCGRRWMDGCSFILLLQYYNISAALLPWLFIPDQSGLFSQVCVRFNGYFVVSRLYKKLHSHSRTKHQHLVESSHSKRSCLFSFLSSFISAAVESLWYLHWMRYDDQGVARTTNRIQWRGDVVIIFLYE